MPEGKNLRAIPLSVHVLMNNDRSSHDQQWSITLRGRRSSRLYRLRIIKQTTQWRRLFN